MSKTNEKSLHTPGRWFVDASKSGSYGAHDFLTVRAHDENGNDVKIADFASRTVGQGRRDRANAELAAAAPSLLNVAQAVASATTHAINAIREGHVGDALEQLEKLAALASEARAKAGQS